MNWQTMNEQEATFSADALPLPIPETWEMARRVRKGKKTHGQNMKQGRPNWSKLKSRASKCRPGLEQTNYRAVQNMQFRASQVKEHYTNKTMQGHCCRMGKPVLIEAIISILE